MKLPEPTTLVVTNFGGPLVRKRDGDLNSGLARYDTSWGYDPYSKPGNLTWLEQPTSILTTGLVTMVAMSNYASGQSTFVHGVDSQSSVYQITVSNGTNPNVDTASVIGAAPGANEWDNGAGITKYGATIERLIIGGDSAVVRVNTDGSSPSVLSGLSGFNNNRPRPLVQFLGKVYFGNGNNIGEIDSTNTVVTMTRLNPGFPFDAYVQDLEVSPDGNYLIITVNDMLLGSAGFDGGSIAVTENRVGTSRKFYWNGIDASYTAQEKYDGLSAFANVSYSDKSYLLGYDLGGAAIFAGSEKIVSLPKVRSPYPTAAFSTSNMLSFFSPEYDDSDGKLKTAFFQYGQYDNETSKGLFRLLKQEAQVRNDIKSIPAALNVSNLVYAASIVGATNHIGGASKVYYSTVESNSQAPANLLGKLWKFSLNPTGSGSVLAGVYETQTQNFSKKVNVKEVRLYTEPLVTDNSFTVDIIGSGGSVLSGGSQIFTVGTNVTSGEDVVKFNPATAPTYAVGIRITNSSVLGTKNWTGVKLEVDVVPAGK